MIDPTLGKIIERFEQGRFKEARKLSIKSFGKKPQDPAIGNILAMCEAELGNYKQAAQLWSDIRKKGAPLDHWLGLGQCYLRLGQFQAVLEIFDSLGGQSNLPVQLFVTTAQAAIETRDYARAISLLEQACALHPTQASLWSNLGFAAQRMADFPKSEAALRQAVALGGRLPDYLFNLARVIAFQYRYDEAGALYEELIALPEAQPTFFGAYALMLSDKGDKAGAHKVYEQGLERFPEAPSLLSGMAEVLFTEGRFAEAWPTFQHRAEQRAHQNKAPLWDGQPLSGTLHVIAEQGHGDTILVARYLAEARKRCDRLVVSVQPSLMGLVASMGLADKVLNMDKDKPGRVQAEALFMSLPALMGLSDVRLPQVPLYPVAGDLPEALQALFDQAGSKLKIGLCWSGNVLQFVNYRRICPVRQLNALSRFADKAQFYSFQVGGALEQMADFEAGMIDLAPHLTGYEVTARAMAELDLMITVDTSVLHLAASQGVPTLGLVSKPFDWRYCGEGETIPWYDSLTVLRQSQPGQWDDVIARLVDKVAAL